MRPIPRTRLLFVVLCAAAGAVRLAGADSATASTRVPLATQSAAWFASADSKEFKGRNESFLKKVSADSALAFEVPKVEIKMAFVPPGSFTMGNEGSEDDERPETPLTITRGYWLGRFEITQDEWKTIMRSNPRLSAFELNPSTYKGSQRPVEFISWKAAAEFCRLVNEREHDAGRLPRGYVYRLPTEAEWEYACRIGVGADENHVTTETGWYAANAKETTHPVGGKRPNHLGLYDMFGNVSEWCQDWFGRYPGKPVSDYTGPSAGDFRVARGGCSFDIAYGCSPSYRTGAEDIVRSAGIGMRLALAPEIK